MLLRYIIQILGSLVFMFTLSPKLTGVLISVVPIVGVGAQQYGVFNCLCRKHYHTVWIWLLLLDSLEQLQQKKRKYRINKRRPKALQKR